MKMIKTLCLLIFSFTLLSPTSYSQTNQLDEKGKKHGLWIKRYPDGEIQYKGEFNHGTPVDTFKRFHANGKLKAIMIYQNPQKVYTKLYDKNEVKKAEGYYYNRKKDSTWNYYNQNGTLISKDTYKSGRKHGEALKFYRSGDTSQISHWKNGEKHGKYKQYFENGNKKLLSNYKNDKVDGYVTVFYPDGTKKIEGKYEDNLKEGKWVYFDEQRDTSQVITYKNGTPLNENKLKRQEYQEILELENNKGKFQSPREEFYKNPSRK